MIKQALTTVLTAGVAVIGLSLAATTGALALGGCVDSPENPTWILAGVGVAAAGVPWLRSVIKRRRNHHDQ